MNPCRRFPSKYLSKAHEIGLVAASFSGGQLQAGVEYGPDAILKVGLREQLRKRGVFTFTDDRLIRYNDWSEESTSGEQAQKHANSLALCSMVTHDISRRAQAQANLGRLVLSIGGDHSIAVGSVSGVAKAMHDRHGKDLAVLWIDAHADLNTPKTSSSGNVHGMPLAFLTGIAKADPAEETDDLETPFTWLQPDHRIPTNKLVYIGLRDVDDTEQEHIDQHSIRAYWASEVRSKGIESVITNALEYIGDDLPVHIGFDIDALDPTVAPSTGLPVPGGLTMQDGLDVIDRISRTGRVVAMDLVEVNPQIDPDGDEGEKTAKAAVDIIAALFHQN